MRFVARRLTFYVVAVWVAVTVNFVIPRVMPGNAVDATKLDPRIRRRSGSATAGPR